MMASAGYPRVVRMPCGRPPVRLDGAENPAGRMQSRVRRPRCRSMMRLSPLFEPWRYRGMNEI
jgi:hypothetical protein